MGCWRALAGSPGAGVVKASMFRARPARLDSIGQAECGKMSREANRLAMARASRRGLWLEHLLGEAKCHAIGLRAEHSDYERHCDRDDHHLELRISAVAAWSLARSFPWSATTSVCAITARYRA
jgi:hypothetical protein